MKTKLTVVTPCLNSEAYIEETLRSVLQNTAVVNSDVLLEYVVCDGKSMDNTVGIIEKVFADVDHDRVMPTLISEKDAGMYDAIAKGLQKATGDIISYINAGDLFAVAAIEIVDLVFRRFPVQWLTGMTVIYNDYSHIISAWLPYRYRRNLIQCGFYDGRLPFIQQEATFWSRDLNQRIDFEKLKTMRYAGDYFLWKTFSEKEELYIIEALLGGWKIHPGQISSNLAAYKREMASLCREPRLLERIQAYWDRFHGLLPNDLKKRRNQQTLIKYDLLANEYALKYRSPKERFKISLE